MSEETEKGRGLPSVDLNEYGGKKDGERQVLNRRMFFQLLVFDTRSGQHCEEIRKNLGPLLQERNIEGVVYADTQSPQGIGLLTWNEDPAHFVDKVQCLFASDLLNEVRLRPQFTMLGRTYGTGHDPDLQHALLRRSIENVLKTEHGWHVWYPLRRKGAFSKLEPVEQSHILREHAALGMAYGQADYAHDIRLACHGIDACDNEFVIGLVGRALYPLSHLVQAMRKTRQTSEFIAHMGPFFVGRVLHRVS